MCGLLSYYRATDNLSDVKVMLTHLRKSCIFTLARKHNKNKVWIYKNYGIDVGCGEGKLIFVYFALG